MSRRVRCVKCQELTNSGWHLTYNGVTGVHCFTCSRLIREKFQNEGKIIGIKIV